MKYLIKEQFEAAVKVIKNLPKNGTFQPTTSLLRLFYAHYKQAVVGSCNISRPAFYDVIGRAKWDSWNELGSMSCEEAMQLYVNELKKMVEIMPQTEEVVDFIVKIGGIYEMVDDDGDVDGEDEGDDNDGNKISNDGGNGDVNSVENQNFKLTNGDVKHGGDEDDDEDDDDVGDKVLINKVDNNNNNIFKDDENNDVKKKGNDNDDNKCSNFIGHKKKNKNDDDDDDDGTHHDKADDDKLTNHMNVLYDINFDATNQISLHTNELYKYPSLDATSTNLHDEEENNVDDISKQDDDDDDDEDDDDDDDDVSGNSSRMISVAGSVVGSVCSSNHEFFDSYEVLDNDQNNDSNYFSINTIVHNNESIPKLCINAVSKSLSQNDKSTLANKTPYNFDCVVSTNSPSLCLDVCKNSHNDHTNPSTTTNKCIDTIKYPHTTSSHEDDGIMQLQHSTRDQHDVVIINQHNQINTLVKDGVVNKYVPESKQIAYKNSKNNYTNHKNSSTTITNYKHTPTTITNYKHTPTFTNQKHTPTTSFDSLNNNFDTKTHQEILVKLQQSLNDLQQNIRQLRQEVNYLDSKQELRFSIFPLPVIPTTIFVILWPILVTMVFRYFNKSRGRRG